MRKKVRYIYVAFAMSFIVTIVISTLYLEEFSALQKSSELLERSHEVKNQVLKVQSNLVEAENSVRGYLITEDKELLTPLKQTQKSVVAAVEKLKELTLNVPEQQKIIARLKETVAVRYKVLYETIDAENGSNLLLFLKNAAKGKLIMKEFMSLSGKIDEVESGLIAKRKLENDWLEIITSFYLKLILILSIVFQVVSFIIITKAFKRRKVHRLVLENKIKELNLNYSEMEQIAFVASHDLQEPLRKIRTFSDKLIKQNAADLNKDGQKLLDKMSASCKRMQELLNDFIHYTRLVKSTEEAGVVLLDRVIDEVRKEFQETIQLKKATLKVDQLPQLFGYNNQLHLLFANLLDNALKFSKAAIPPTIQITVSKGVKGETEAGAKYTRISFRDNGIGFEKEFAEKIFVIFQRLHSQNSLYIGKGIGLAICKRVMMNHDGYITANGEAGGGATFNLYFPEKNGQ